MTDRTDLITPTATFDMIAVRQVAGAFVRFLQDALAPKGLQPHSDHLLKDVGQERDPTGAGEELTLYVTRHMNL